jgi:hypothetical protein
MRRRRAVFGTTTMYSMPIEWVAVGPADAPSDDATYAAELQQRAADAEQALVAGVAAVLYECCAVRWWQHGQADPLDCAHCGCAPRLVPADAVTGYGLFECPRCRWTWTSQQPHCRKGVTSSRCVNCHSTRAVMAAVGPADARDAFLELHWTRRCLRRAAAAGTIGGGGAAVTDGVPVALTCPACNHSALYSNPLARRCCRCRVRVFVRTASVLGGDGVCTQGANWGDY